MFETLHKIEIKGIFLIWQKVSIKKTSGNILPNSELLNKFPVNLGMKKV